MHDSSPVFGGALIGAVVIVSLVYAMGYAGPAVTLADGVLADAAVSAAGFAQAALQMLHALM